MFAYRKAAGFFGFFSASNQALFRNIVESAPNAIVLVDQDGRITLVNAQTEKLFDYPRTELLGQPVERLVPERFRAAHPGHRMAFFAHPSARAMGVGRDLFGLRRDGREFPIEIGLNPIQGNTGPMVLASIIDLTERKRSEELFRLVVESAPNAMIMANRGGHITLVNTQTEKLFGYPRKELIGQAIELLVPERFRTTHPAHRAAFFSSPSMRSMGAGRDLFGLHKEGREFPIEIGLTPIQDETGAMVLASIIDITERKRAEQGIRLLMKQIQETSGVLTASTSEILETASQVAAGSAETASAVSQTTSTMEEIKQTAQVATEKSQHVSDTAQQAASISQDGRQAVQESIEAMQHIQKQMESIAENIIRLSEQGQAIGEIITTVNDLAEQSNLLAVNAAIEAAKAGEHGKGFSVVAQEVKSLAAQSKQATAQVRSILGDIQKATSKAVMSTEQGSKAVDSGVRLSQRVEEAITVLSNSVEEAAQAAMQIAVSARQQLVGLDQAVLAIRSISQASQLNTESARKSEAVAHKLHELSLTLKNMLEQGER